MEMARSVFRFIVDIIGRFGRFKYKRNRAETEPNRTLLGRLSRRNQPNGRYFEGFGV